MNLEGKGPDSGGDEEPGFIYPVTQFPMCRPENHSSVIPATIFWTSFSFAGLLLAVAWLLLKIAQVYYVLS